MMVFLLLIKTALEENSVIVTDPVRYATVVIYVHGDKHTAL